MTPTLPTPWPAARLPLEVARVLRARFGAVQAQRFLLSARRAGWVAPPTHTGG